MKNKIFLLIFICYIAFSLFSCVPAPENAKPAQEFSNYIILGFWHGIIIPFSILGKIVGLNIGIIDRGKISDLTYIVGYGYALYIYFSLIRPLVLEFWSSIRGKYTKNIC